MDKTEVTRQQLYEEVWQTPRLELAKKYCISDTGLGKICKRNNIPTPKRGYWAKVHSGKRVRRLLLPNPEENSTIIIPKTSDPESEHSFLKHEEAIQFYKAYKDKCPQSRIVVLMICPISTDRSEKPGKNTEPRKEKNQWSATHMETFPLFQNTQIKTDLTGL